MLRVRCGSYLGLLSIIPADETAKVGHNGGRIFGTQRHESHVTTKANLDVTRPRNAYHATHLGDFSENRTHILVRSPNNGIIAHACDGKARKHE
jgi:hypothetical protein